MVLLALLLALYDEELRRHVLIVVGWVGQFRARSLMRASSRSEIQLICQHRCHIVVLRAEVFPRCQRYLMHGGRLVLKLLLAGGL